MRKKFMTSYTAFEKFRAERGAITKFTVDMPDQQWIGCVLDGELLMARILPDTEKFEIWRKTIFV